MEWLFVAIGTIALVMLAVAIRDEVKLGDKQPYFVNHRFGFYFLGTALIGTIAAVALILPTH